MENLEIGFVLTFLAVLIFLEPLLAVYTVGLLIFGLIAASIATGVFIRKNRYNKTFTRKNQTEKLGKTKKM